MNTIKIKWTQTNYNNLGDLYDTYFYAFSRANALLYIGISYDQNVGKEIDQTLRRLGISTTGLTIWLGYVDDPGTTYQRITKQLVLDAECLMILTNQPKYNQQCTESYAGRCDFKVQTTGCSLIRRCVRCENDRIYQSC